MKLNEALTVINTSIVLETENKREVFESKSAIPESWMNYVVTSIRPDNRGIIISLESPIKAKTLEELGYSFESGM